VRFECLLLLQQLAHCLLPLQHVLQHRRRAVQPVVDHPTALLRLAVVQVVQQSPRPPVRLLLALTHPKQLQILVNLGVEERRPKLVGVGLVEDGVMEDLFLEGEVGKVLPDQAQGQDSAILAEAGALGLFLVLLPELEQVGASIFVDHLLQQLTHVLCLVQPQLDNMRVTDLTSHRSDLGMAAVRQHYLGRPVSVYHSPGLMQVLVFWDLFSVDLVSLAVEQHNPKGIGLLVEGEEEAFPAGSIGVHGGVEGRGDDFADLPLDDAMDCPVLWILDFVHDEDGDSLVEKLPLGLLDLFVPEVHHQVLRKLLESLFPHFAESYGVVFEGEVLHHAELQEHYGSHVAAFGAPVDFKHRTHAFVLFLSDL